MNNKYLPIGTVCTLKGNNKKIMVISYFSIEYNGNVTMYDYKGCVYPEGLLLPSQVISFNHDQIENIDFLGFKNDQYEVFNNALNRNIEEPDKDYDRKAFMANLKFDENGVVVFDGNTSLEENLVSNEPAETVNPFKNEYSTEIATNHDKANIFKFDENGVVISDGTETNENSASTPKYQFDENGFVISDGTETVNSNFTPAPQGTNNYKFDENGVVISDGVDNVSETSTTSQYKFDENGTVIDDGTEVINSTPAHDTTNNYKFDENGVVISDGTDENSTATNIPQYQFDENGTVISDETETVNNTPAPQVTGGYKFDENGMVISE